MLHAKVRTTIDLPDDLFREAKSTAALLGQPLEELVAEALRERLRQLAAHGSDARGWRSVFGKAKPAQVDAVQESIDEFSSVDPDDVESGVSRAPHRGLYSGGQCARARQSALARNTDRRMDRRARGRTQSARGEPRRALRQRERSDARGMVTSAGFRRH